MARYVISSLQESKQLRAKSTLKNANANLRSEITTRLLVNNHHQKDLTGIKVSKSTKVH